MDSKELVEYYKNHTLKETCKHFKIGQRKILKACTELGFKKPAYTWKDWDSDLKKRARDKAIATCIERYGKGSVTAPDKISKARTSPGWWKEHRESYERVWEHNKKLLEDPDYREKRLEIAKKAGPTIRKGLLARTSEELDRFRDNYKKTCLEKYGVENTWALAKSVNHSKGELEVKDFLVELGFNPINSKKIIPPFELDLYLEDKKFAIEYNGTFWHSSEVKGRSYHYLKSVECEKRGIRLFHIYEWEWRDPIKQEIIKSVLRVLLGKVEQRIYARECEIREVGQADYRKFCENNHLQGYRQASIVYGLYYKDELRQLMSFSKPQKRGAKETYEWEIVRGCPGSNNLVIGGVSKLWKHFLKEKNPNSVMSYCDANKFDGKSYLELGMVLKKFDKNNVWYIDRRTGKVTQWIFRDREKREDQLENSYKVYGVGNKLYVWYKKNFSNNI